MFGVNGNTLGDIEADIAAQEAYGGGWADVGDPGMGGPVGPSSKDGSADPTMNVVSGASVPAQVASFTNALKAAMSFSPMQQAMKWGMSMMPQDMRAPMYGVMDLPGYQGLVENLGQDPNLAQAYGATTGVPYGFDEAMQNVPVVGSGAHLGLATNIANIGGQNVHMGPGFMMNENNYPGYGVNPVTGEGFADPGDPYIRKRRGTEIAAMIGP
jgi:hypothetical protein